MFNVRNFEITVKIKIEGILQYIASSFLGYREPCCETCSTATRPYRRARFPRPTRAVASYILKSANCTALAFPRTLS